MPEPTRRLADFLAAPPAGGFLQVQIRRFELRRESRGLCFAIRLDGDEPALCSSADKIEASRRIDVAAGRRCEAEIAAFRREARPGESVVIDFPESFRPRHASGGALVLHEDDGLRALLVERDIAPRGWNLMNGAAADVDELLDVESLIARELREELLLLDPQARRLRVLAAGAAGDPAECERTRALWTAALGVGAGAPLACIFENGPDSLEVTAPDGRWRRSDGLFVDLQAEDFGIECLRLARLGSLGALRPLDGEIGRRGGEAMLLDRCIASFALGSPFIDLAPPPPRWAWRRGELLLPDAAPILGALCPVVRKILSRLDFSPRS